MTKFILFFSLVFASFLSASDLYQCKAHQLAPAKMESDLITVDLSYYPGTGSSVFCNSITKVGAYVSLCWQAGLNRLSLTVQDLNLAKGSASANLGLGEKDSLPSSFDLEATGSKLPWVRVTCNR